MCKLEKARTEGEICPRQQNGGQNGPAPQQRMQNIGQLLKPRRNFQKKAPPPTTCTIRCIPQARFSFARIVKKQQAPFAVGERDLRCFQLVYSKAVLFIRVYCQSSSGPYAVGERSPIYFQLVYSKSTLFHSHVLSIKQHAPTLYARETLSCFNRGIPKTLFIRQYRQLIAGLLRCRRGEPQSAFNRCVRNTFSFALTGWAVCFQSN